MKEDIYQFTERMEKSGRPTASDYKRAVKRLRTKKVRRYKSNINPFAPRLDFGF